MRRTVALAGLAALTVGACGTGGAAESTIPNDPDAPVLAVTLEGGFVPVEFNLDRMPQYLITADRTLYYVGPITLEFPGPILPNVQVTTLDEESYSEVLSLLEELGMADIEEEVDQSAAQMVADAATTFLNYYDDNGVHRYGFYAIEMTDGASTDRLLANEVLELLQEATAATQSRPYEADRLQVAAGPPLQDDEGLGAVEEWPLAVTFEEMDDWGMGWRCTEVTGDDVDRLVEVFAAANQATAWESDGEQFGIRARPLLPGETACQNAPQTS